MRRLVRFFLLAGFFAAFALSAPAAPAIEKDISFRNEVQHAIDRGLTALQSLQKSNGVWSTADQPAVTALALMAFKGEPTGKYRRAEPAFLKNGYAFILNCVKPDGSIHQGNLVTYNTSISM